MWLVFLWVGFWGKQRWLCRRPGSCGSLSFLDLAALPSVVLVPLHTTPKDVEKELNALYDVFLDVYQRWQNEVGVIDSMAEGMVQMPFSKTQWLLSSLECDSAWRLQCRLCIADKKTSEKPATPD
jgi:hypothetical protein